MVSEQGFDRNLDRPRGYNELLGQLVRRVERAQVRAVLAVNRELVVLYWEIGREILRQQTERGWGATVIDHLSQDLRARFPQQQGFSARNLKYMRSLAKAWEEPESVQQPVAQIPWGHHCALLDRMKEPRARRWYAEAALAMGGAAPFSCIRARARTAAHPAYPRFPHGARRGLLLRR